jgi:hypothetical protein
MNGMKILGTVLVVSLMIFVMASIASAQPYDGILHNQWFKLTLSMKGYEVDSDGETVMGKGGGSTHAYLYMSYTGTGYTITTCMQDMDNDDIWNQWTAPAPIPIDNIYGATYPQVWDFQANNLEFDGGKNTYSVYPTFYTKITADKADPAKLKNATISNVSCAVYVDMVSGGYGCGSCTIKGSLIPAAKVPTTVPGGPTGCQ